MYVLVVSIRWSWNWIIFNAAVAAILSELEVFEAAATPAAGVAASDIFVSVGSDEPLFVEPSEITVKTYFLFFVRFSISAWTVVAPTLRVRVVPPLEDVAVIL